VIFAMTVNDKWLPLDAAPRDGGGFVLVDEGRRVPTAHFIKLANRLATQTRYGPHWETCPHAEEHRTQKMHHPRDKVTPSKTIELLGETGRLPF